MANPRELADQAFTLLQDALRDAEARVAELDAELKRKREPRDEIERRLGGIEGECSKWRLEAEQLDELLQNERAKVQQLKKKLATAESGPDRLTKREINFWRQRVEEFDTQAKEYRTRIAHLQHKLKARTDAGAAHTDPPEIEPASVPDGDAAEAAQRENRALREQIDQYHAELESLRNQYASLTGSTSDSVSEVSARADEAGRRLHEAEAALENARATQAHMAEQQQRIEAALAAATERAETAEGANQTLTERLTETDCRLADKEQQLGGLDDHRAQLEQTLTEARARIDALEAELREEKEVSDNLSELANGRRETVTKLQEKVEELEERFAESEWRLGKAKHFERLVRRRKGLIKNLIATIKAKYKTNTALKAGLDGLRTYKATAEANQQKLLKRIDKLKAELGQTREKLAERTVLASAEQPKDEEPTKVTALEERLSTQAEIIESLESDLKVAKAMRHTSDDSTTEIADLRQTLEHKDKVIAGLQLDIEEQARRLGKLRGSENETVRLKALAEQDKQQIEVLKREIAQLRDILSRTQADQPDADVPDLIDKLEVHAQSIAELMSTIEEKDSHIATLTEAADEWKRKYEFLSTEERDGYESAAQNNGA